MKDIFKTKKYALILSHQSPDGDSVGSSVSLSLYLNKLGIQNKIIFPDNYPSFYSWVKGIENSIIASENIELLNDLFDKSDLIICLDFNHRKRVGTNLSPFLFNLSDKHVIVIDHHTNPENFGDTEIIDTNASSTCELVFN
jgi:phosphoesterase RecJ-like protein